ncbi:MAG: lytic transglycosylase domain-containing protein, partial [Betaproteobacteria bacterium]
MRRRWLRTLRRASPAAQAIVAGAVVFALWLGLNWAYQVMRKPSELFFPVSGALYKTPYETWREYGTIFRGHATNVITADLLAALAQVEGSGNPVARTSWRWSLRRQPFDVYRPGSSAVGMYQMTDATFAQARRYCIHDHRVAKDGRWDEFNSCWFNSMYTRTLPTHAVELTSAHLDRGVANLLKRLRIDSATFEQKQNLAAVIHLCGARSGEIYARRGFRLVSGQRCGDHLVP